MSSRIRKERGTAVGSDEQQLWQSVRSHLRSLEKLQSSSINNLQSLDQFRTKFLKENFQATTNQTNASRESSLSIDENEKLELQANYRKYEKSLEEEEQEISRALERLEVLLAVRDDEAGGSGSIGNSNSNLNNNIADLTSSKRNKKRRLDAGSISPTLQASSLSSKDRAFSPVSIDGDPAPSSSGNDRKRSKGQSSANPSGTGAGSTGSGSGTSGRRMTASSIGKDSTPADGTGISSSSNAAASGKDGYVDPARARREVLAHQLPLQKGRKVAFRQPNKNKVGPGAANVSSSRSGGSGTGDSSSSGLGGGSGSGGAGTMEDDGETWIMATVIECINNDRNRYVVQDDEDEGMPTYNTTLKAIVPLPENLNTLPLEDYKVGTHVLGLYPDTSCFYRAIVRGGGPGLNGKVTQKMQRRAEEVLNTSYHLEFEDDDGAIRDVPANLVVERP